MCDRVKNFLPTGIDPISAELRSAMDLTVGFRPGLNLTMGTDGRNLPDNLGSSVAETL